ncbi:SAM-dependent methyltransferase [Nannocystis sp. ncelm1]|uniref:S-adenosyl-L-methionine-dependent methyltransferase n=2 Tax=Nannocystis radixulma TaxID=2995305 RepID=A0ABT5BFK3_9BACT|nr:SAM-dependent methyltransferase [Nannocystis radixulma]
MASPRPSRTALKIARFMLLLDAVPRFAGLLPVDAAAAVEGLLRASGAVRPRHIDVMRRPATYKMYRFIEGMLGRGQLLWFGVRKRWMADCVESAIAAGATQLLVVGAGFDSLAALVARRHPHVTCVEIDAPATAEPKRAGLQGAGLARDNLHVRAADLAHRELADVLRETPWRPDARSVVVAEGLLMYLDAASVARFFAAVHASTGPGSRLACSLMDGDADDNPHIGALDWPIRLALRLAGEPLRWGIAPAKLPAFAASAGYRVLDQPDAAALRDRLLAPLGLRDEPLLPYEHLALLARA